MRCWVHFALDSFPASCLCFLHISHLLLSIPRISIAKQKVRLVVAATTSSFASSLSLNSIQYGNSCLHFKLPLLNHIHSFSLLLCPVFHPILSVRSLVTEEKKERRTKADTTSLETEGNRGRENKRRIWRTRKGIRKRNEKRRTHSKTACETDSGKKMLKRTDQREYLWVLHEEWDWERSHAEISFSQSSWELLDSWITQNKAQGKEGADQG